MLVYMPMPRRARARSWLSITPEPERLLPAAIATLRAGGRPSAAAIARERARLDEVIARARRRAWRDYLTAALALAQRSDGAADAELACARALTLELLADHDNLLLGLPSR